MVIERDTFCRSAHAHECYSSHLGVSPKGIFHMLDIDDVSLTEFGWVLVHVHEDIHVSITYECQYVWVTHNKVMFTKLMSPPLFISCA